MTIPELDRLGHDKPVMYRGGVVTYLYLTQRFAPGVGRKQPMKATVRLRSGREVNVFLKSLSHVAEVSA